jgi:hypothetical protein
MIYTLIWACTVQSNKLQNWRLTPINQSTIIKQNVSTFVLETKENVKKINENGGYVRRKTF